ncbi:MAG: hypothetical protein P4L96_17380 [Rhodoferax sp.]|nr:hypothetical protein [Rhodoferax sp.]
MKQIFGLCIVAATLALSQAAWAQTPTVTSKLAANRIELVDGKTVRGPATQVKPGDVVEYSTTYANTGKSAVEHLQATLPIPAGMTLLADSAQPGKAQATADNVNFAAMPLMHSVKQADGSTRQEPVPLADYRALRWDVGTIAPGKDAVVSLRVRVNPPLGSAAPKP